jgi:hypothetical protein
VRASFRILVGVLRAILAQLCLDAWDLVQDPANQSVLLLEVQFVTQETCHRPFEVYDKTIPLLNQPQRFLGFTQLGSRCRRLL